MSWRTSVFHVSTLTYGVYELGKNPVNHGLACCLSVEFYVYVLGSHIGEKEKNCGLLIKRTTGTIGMKRRFDKDRNFTSLNICKKMVTRLCQKCIHEVHSWLHEPDQICELSALTKDTRVIKWYRRHSSVRYVLFCRSACNFGVNQSNKLFYNITAS